MAIRDKLSGNEAVAVAMRQIDPDVVAAFPITPSTEVPQYFSQFVANGAVHTEFVAVESEHSAMSACIGSEAAGGRTHDGHLGQRARVDVGNALYRGVQPPAHRVIGGQPGAIRPHQYPQRPQRQHGPPVIRAGSSCTARTTRRPMTA